MTTSLLGSTITQRLFTARGHNQIMNKLNRDTMFQIRDTLMPFHFMTVAFSRYGDVFQKRTKKYQMMKARTVHHQRPNEYSGALRLAVLSESKIAATATRGTFQAKAPEDSVVKFGKHAGKRIRRPLTEQRRKELEYVSPEETQMLCDRQQARYVAEVYDPANREIVLKQFR